MFDRRTESVKKHRIKQEYSVMGSAMKKMCGFVLFWIAAGMTIMMFVNSCVLGICLIIFCLILAYNLFCSK